ncbi:MAG: TolC family protein [Betaproteobacteria bacterium HGW-Betaproteobacteria-22]|nr:MAG: TolC family protein [Betaproteobacteria bacterium HGW-Betaproteobacteria-22]
MTRCCPLILNSIQILRVFFLFASVVLTGCGFQSYAAKPLDVNQISQKISHKTPHSDEFKQYLINNGYPAALIPIKQWGLTELSYCAIFFHPSLDVARTQWRAAQLAESTAAIRPSPSIGTNLGKSNNANDDISPYLFGLSIDIPIETAGKRDIRIARATHLSQAAKLEIAQTAWALREQVASALTNYHSNLAQIELLKKEVAHRDALVAMYLKRATLGVASSLEVSNARLQSHSAHNELNAKVHNTHVLLAQLASSTGLPLHVIQDMPLADHMDSELVAKNLNADNLAVQSDALLNRLDIRIALERYASAEAKLKQEIAGQYPDLSINPAYTYEFGNKVWSLGISGLLTLLHKNKLAIAEATQLREVEAAQFEVLQNKIISDTASVIAELEKAKQVLSQQTALYQRQQGQTAKMQSRFNAGEIDRIELTMANLEELSFEKSLLLAKFQLLSVLQNIETLTQKPLGTHADKSDTTIIDKLTLQAPSKESL